jgi:hypothetical protein
MVDYVRDSLDRYVRTQHMISHIHAEVTGDDAEALVYLHSVHVRELDQTDRWGADGWYRKLLEAGRSPDGRVTRVELHRDWQAGGDVDFRLSTGARFEPWLP